MKDKKIIEASFNCLSCDTTYKNPIEYVEYSNSKSKNYAINFDSINLNSKLEICLKCSPFTTGAIESILKLGNVEKFRRKMNRNLKK